MIGRHLGMIILELTLLKLLDRILQPLILFLFQGQLLLSILELFSLGLACLDMAIYCVFELPHFTVFVQDLSLELCLVFLVIVQLFDGQLVLFFIPQPLFDLGV